MTALPLYAIIKQLGVYFFQMAVNLTKNVIEIFRFLPNAIASLTHALEAVVVGIESGFQKERNI